MNFTPQVPTELSTGAIKRELISIAEEIVIKSAKITGSYNNIVLTSIQEMLQNVNSYYSNQIEAEGTHPIDTEKAIRKEYSENDEERKLQMLSLAHIKTQNFIKSQIGEETKIISKEFIKEIHRFFYNEEGMDSFCETKLNEQNIKMVPGQIREVDVAVGNHIALKFSDVDYLLNMFESLYKTPSYMPKSERLIYALSSHHRLVWIHPFIDGNGRVSRLFLDAFLHDIGLEGYGLWNISRGLSWNIKEYRLNLAKADEIKLGERDGRGYLSNSNLEEFVRFMLKTALDQVEYMDNCLKLNNLSQRIENYCKSANASFLGIDPLPKGSEKLFKELLLHGEIQRGDVPGIIGKKKTVASATIKELLNRYYLASDGPRKPLRLNFNAHFSSKLFPELMPDMN